MPTPEDIIASILTATQDRIASNARTVIAISGPPASGKSTISEGLVANLNARGISAALLPMDGFHLDDRILIPRGLRPRKGAPETFDFYGFAAMVRRLRSGESIFAPVFDRSREIAIAAAQEIAPETRVVVVEGNYLLLDQAPWNSLRDAWDYSVFFGVDEDELRRRLIARWQHYGLTPDEITVKIEENDLPNARLVMAQVGACDLVLGDQA